MAIHKPIYDRLKAVARAAQTVYYGEIARLADLDLENPGDRTRLGTILDDINRFEQTEKRPMLSAVVINAEENQPGDGFFSVARDLGLQGNQPDLEFFVRELGRVHAYWAAHPTDD